MLNSEGSSVSGIEVVGLIKRFGDRCALDGVSFSVEPGEVLGLLGPNGAGKTTTVNILATLLRPDGGTPSVAGFDVVAAPHEVRRRVALTGQFAAVDEVLTGPENLTLFGRLRGLGRQEANRKAAELIERFDLVGAGTDKVGAYSGGMRRRLDLAASLVTDVPVLFLDEPTTGLDPRSRAALWSIVRELRSAGRTIVLTTQYLEEADHLAERIVVIDHGRVVATGTPTELKARAGGQSCVVVPVDPGRLDAIATALGGLGELTVDHELGTVSVGEADHRDLAEILRRLDDRDIEVSEVSLRRPSLDDVFLQLTEDESDRSGSDMAGSEA